MSAVVGIGWDVGGWHGRGNAVVALRWTGDRIEPLGDGCKALPDDVCSLDGFVNHFCGDAAASAVRSAAVVVVGIDAPLGFPTAFRELLADLAGARVPPRPTSGFLENPLAFRETDREIARRFPSKAPLSAAFDKLGNPATVAMHYARRWTAGSGPVVDRETPRARRVPVAIEVYPALSKREPRRAASAMSPYGPALGERSPDTHVYDAAIAAILALGWAVGDDAVLPRLAVTASERGEGAIWYPAHPEWRLPTPTPKTVTR
jgi:hypothetical protein